MANIKISELNELTQKANNDYVPIVDTSADETKKISVKDLIPSNVTLLAVSSTEPEECYVGDKYFNTTTNLIYTAIERNVWGITGEQAQFGITYIVFDKQTAYAYNGTTLVSVGGGSGGETLPVGTEVDFDGQVSDIPAGWEQVSGKSYVAYVLYNNTSGSYSTITLSDSASNYDYIEIYYKTNDNGAISSRKYYRLWGDANRVDLDYGWYVGNTIYYKTANVVVNGTSVTFSNNMQYADFASKESGNFILITRVVGYKEV